MNMSDNTNAAVKTVKTDTFEMDYLHFGNGKRPLVVLPGLSVTSVMALSEAVQQSYRLLCDDFDIYLIERRKNVPKKYTNADMAKDTAEAIRKIGLKDICLYGVSQGGMIAMKIAIDNPDLVGKLAVCSTAARIDDERFALLEEWVRLAKEGKREELYLLFGEKVYSRTVFLEIREGLITAAKDVTDEELAHFAVIADGIRDFNITGELQSVQCPMLLFGAEDDEVLGYDAIQEIIDTMNGRDDFEAYSYHGYGHAVYDFGPDLKEKLLVFFCK